MVHRVAAAIDDPAADLGDLLTGSQAVTHAFVIPNPLARDLHIIAAYPRVSCCSAIRNRPTTIPAGSQGQVDVDFRPGQRSGRVAVEYYLQTDNPAQPVITLRLVMNLLPELEWAESPDSTQEMLRGETGQKRFRVTSRRRDGKGRAAPSTITAPQGIQARFEGAPVSQPSSHPGWEVATREVFVSFQAGPKLGPQFADAVLGWPDGVERPLPIRWSVSPRIVANSPAQVLNTPGESAHLVVLLNSRTGPFRVTGIQGDVPVRTVARIPTESAKSHRLELDFDADANSRDPVARDIRFATDDPLEPEVVATVLRGAKGGGP